VTEPGDAGDAPTGNGLTGDPPTEGPPTGDPPTGERPTDHPSTGDSPAGAPAPPPTAASVFGPRLPMAEAYADRLAGDGVVRGLIGPREVPRLWDRHLLNSAVLTELLPDGDRVADVGSGAGLPGLVMAIRRPDLRVVLIEPMQRRVEFLAEVVDTLGLAEQVRVVRGRAEEPRVRAEAGDLDSVVARAVAPLDRLVKWCLPLVPPGGRLLALKGARAGAEAGEHRSALRRAGAGGVSVQMLGAGVLEEPTWVVVVERAAASTARRRREGSR
jgi:16S rRNA (guanine527-N7)-methyltransferase